MELIVLPLCGRGPRWPLFTETEAVGFSFSSLPLPLAEAWGTTSCPWSGAEIGQDGLRCRLQPCPVTCKPSGDSRIPRLPVRASGRDGTPGASCCAVLPAPLLRHVASVCILLIMNEVRLLAPRKAPSLRLSCAFAHGLPLWFLPASGGRVRARALSRGSHARASSSLVFV